jgi:flagellar biosynthesis/type III secretory pathway M-ring protein FliF/YscJ
MDPEAVKAQEMLSQVQHMVGENPDAAAAMIKRWLNR